MGWPDVFGDSMLEEQSDKELRNKPVSTRFSYFVKAIKSVLRSCKTWVHHNNKVLFLGHDASRIGVTSIF